MSNSNIALQGILVGQRLTVACGAPDADIVQVPQGHGPDGPAQGSFVLVDLTRSQLTARYLSWINYFDVEYAIHREQGEWRIVEPGEEYSRDVEWSPWGWPGARGVPTIGDALLARAAGCGGSD